MSSDGVSEVSAGIGERVGGMVNGTSLLQGWEAVVVVVVAEIHVNNELVVHQSLLLYC